jgi:UDP-N-acetylmuramate: L-alanyl-gamma-D-glutamyl-meso-diaminopimelate ligase
MDFLPPGARVHLIGIGGTGMASLAGLLKESGFQITGSDANVYPPMSTLLQELGIPVMTPYAARNLQSKPDLVIVGNALSRGNPEVEETLNEGLPYESMAEAVKRLCLDGRQSLVVAGTHGKTTTTSMLAWILEVAGHSAGLSAGPSAEQAASQLDTKFRPGFLIGGKPENFPTGFRAQPERGGFFVIEGDEYDTAFFDKGPKFLHYLPRAVVLTSVEYDHADIYPDLESVKQAFKRLVNLVPASGLIVAMGDSLAVEECLSKAYCPVERYGKGANCMWRAEGIESYEEWTRFEVFRGGARFLRADLKASGDFNVMNALGAVAMASHYGVPDRVIRQALTSFKGVKRRLEIRGVEEGITLIDDFAHHPTAIRETLKAVRRRFPGKPVWAIVEPRSNTLRRRVFEDELVDSLAGADRVTLAAVFQGSNIPEKERLEPGRVVTRLLREGVKASALNSVNEIIQQVVSQAMKGDVIVVMSNGGFDGIHEKLLAKLAGH